MKEGVIGDMSLLGVTESFQVKRQVLLSAAEAAEMILRVDDVIKAAPRYDQSICMVSQSQWCRVNLFLWKSKGTEESWSKNALLEREPDM